MQGKFGHFHKSFSIGHCRTISGECQVTNQSLYSSYLDEHCNSHISSQEEICISTRNQKKSYKNMIYFDLSNTTRSNTNFDTLNCIAIPTNNCWQISGSCRAPKTRLLELHGSELPHQKKFLSPSRNYCV